MAKKQPPPPSSPCSVKDKMLKLGLTDVNEGNVVPIDPEKFTPEQKKEFEAILQQARDQFLKSFMQTRKGTLVQKYKIKVVADDPGTSSSKDGDGKQAPDGSAQPSIKGATDGSLGNQGDNSQGVHGVQGDGVHGVQGDGAQGLQGGNLNQNSDVAQDFFNNFQDQVDYAVHHALINQSGVLVNTLSNMMKSIADGSIAEHQAAGPVYLHGGVFPNYRSLITDVQPSTQAVPSVAPTTQPTAPTSTPLPASSAMAPGQPMNPRLLMREQPQHGGQVVQPIRQQVMQPVQQTPPRQQPLQPIQQTPLRQQIVQPIQHQGSISASAGFATPGGQPVQQFLSQDVPEHLVHHVQPDGTVMPQVVPEHLPYPKWFERVPLPNRFKVPDFSKFSGQDGVSTYEHISRLLAQCGEASAVDSLKVRLFRLSLSGSAFTWFSSLPYGSINSSTDLEKQFHSYFYSEVHEMKLSDLTAIKQRHDEPVHEYIQIFKEMRNKCFSLSLTDAQLADLAFQGMIAPIREKFSSEDFDSLSHLIQKVTLHEHRSAEVRKSSKKVNHVCPYMYGSDDDEADSEIAAAKWVRSKNVIPCQWVKSSGKEEKYDFDITKADKIFDLLLREKQIQLPTSHTIPSAEELGKKRYCKWHNSGSHSTNDCKVFRQQIQVAIEGGKIRFDDSKKPMKVDGNPFPVNMLAKQPIGSVQGVFKRIRLRLSTNIRGSMTSSRRGIMKNTKMVLILIGVVSSLDSAGMKNQKIRVQRLRNRERLQEVEQEINHRLRKAKPRQEWRVKNQVPVADDVAADEVKRLAKGKSVVTAPVNMVFTLLAEFGIDQADVNEVEEESAKLVLSPEQAVFEKPEGTENRHLKPLYINGYVNGKPMSKMMVDGGAAVNLMPYATFRKLGRNAEDLIKTNMVLKDFGGNPSETKGVLNVELTVGSKTIPTTFFVIDGKGSYSLLLGRDWIHANCCIPSTMHQCLIQWQGDKIEIVPADSQLKMENPSYYFEGVVEGSNVYNKDTVDDLNDKQVPVIKKNGKVRVCIDFRDLNKATPKDEYPMPVADQLVDAASGNKILSFIDGNAGYNQIFMTEEDMHKTAFRCPGAIGLFEWVVMTFGLKSAGATYQRAMNYIYHDLIGWLVEVYIDDVVVKSKEIEDHIADLRKVFERTRKYGLKMNPTKCAFGVSAGQFWDFLFMKEGSRLRHYLLSNECTVICKADVVKYMLSAPILKGRVGKWIFSLTEFDHRYESLKAIKGQAIADFIVEHRDDSIGSVEIVPWTLFFDGSVCTHGCGIGLVIISPRGAYFEFAYTIKPYATNNQAEYEAVLKGLQLLKKVEAETIEIMGDSLLVISQLAGEYECKNDTLMVYNEKCQELKKEFRLVTLKHVSREQNIEANDLAHGASGYKPMIKDVKVEIAAMTADDWRYDVHQCSFKNI
uniref:Polyprotein n=1 Tax=Oryza sativa subsp. japonica TaxID=39947 RepID=Q6AVD1_ORYSJ|nr:putative polyprotein [Oryza sativa Japonica Group]